MIRIVVFLLVVALIGFGAAWIADRPGEVAITWQGWRMETSVTVAAVVLDYSGKVIGVVAIDGSYAPVIECDGSSDPTLSLSGEYAPTLSLPGSTHG